MSNAAANLTAATLFDTSEEVWDKIFDVNVKSSFLLMQESLPLLRQSKSPSIILTSSIAAYHPINVNTFLSSMFTMNLSNFINNLYMYKN